MALPVRAGRHCRGRRAARLHAAEHRRPDARTEVAEEVDGVGREGREGAAGEHLGPDERSHGQGAQTDRQDRTEQHRMACRDARRPARERPVVVLAPELLQALVQERLGALEPPRQPQRRGHESADVAVANGSNGLRADPAAQGPGEVGEVPPPRRE